MTNQTDARPTIVNPDGMFDPTPMGFSQVVIAPAGARIAHISGQGGADATGALAIDFQTQLQNAFYSLRAALGGIGAEPWQVVKLTIYVVDHDMGKLGPVTQAVTEMFAPTLPAQTLVAVPALAIDGMLVEVEATVALT